MRIKHYGSVDDKGKLILGNPDHFKSELQKLKGKNRVFIVVDEERPTRSNEQLRYWFGVMLPKICDYILETTGVATTPEEMHDFYIDKGYFGLSTKKILGEEIIIRNRSRKMNTMQFKEVIEKVQKEWAEKGLIIPDPNQIDFLETANND